MKISISGVFVLSLCMIPMGSLSAKPVDYKSAVQVIRDSSATIGLDQTRGKMIRGYVFNDTNWNGKLDRKEKGVENVLVSNGLDVYQTKADGYYELAIRDNMSVFVTKPAGYKLPVDQNNVPQFYYHHLPKGSPELRFGGLEPTGPAPAQINFPLVKTEKLTKFKAVFSGDTQPYSNNELNYLRDSLAQQLSEMDEIQFVFVEGDVMGDDLSLFPRFKAIMSMAEAPLYLVPGNHDLDFDAKTDAHSKDTYRREFGPTYYSFDIGDVHFIALDNVRYPCTPEQNINGSHPFCADPEGAPTYNGNIDPVQMQWLKNDLRHTPKDKLIVLNMHIPIVTFIDMDATKHQLDNAKELYALLEGREVVSFSGHTHTTENIAKGEFYKGWYDALGVGPSPFNQIVAGAASGSWWSGDFNQKGIPMSYQRNGSPRGYYVLEFDGNTYRDTYKAADYDMKDQMTVDFLTPSFVRWYKDLRVWMATDVEARSAIPPVNINDLPDTSTLTLDELSEGISISANVWNGSQDTKVTAQINTLNPIPMRRTQAGYGEGQLETLDPFALKKQMYVFRYAAVSESGDPRAQGFELWTGSTFTGNPQPLQEWMLTDQSNHIWQVPLPDKLPLGNHLLTVRATDRYGREFVTKKTFEVVKERPVSYFNTDAFEN